MQQTYQVWASRSGRAGELYAHTVSNAALDVRPLSGVTINERRVSRPWFHTQGRLSVGSTLAQVRRGPGLHREAQGRAGGRSVIYASARGR